MITALPQLYRDLPFRQTVVSVEAPCPFCANISSDLHQYANRQLWVNSPTNLWVTREGQGLWE